MMVHVRGGDPMTLVPRVRDVAAALDPSLRLVSVQRVNEVTNDVRWQMGLWVRITLVLSTIALILALAGIYAVLSFTVARRTREIGVRVALGASRRPVVAATFRRPLLQVSGGIVLGTAIVFTAASIIKYTEFPGFGDRPHRARNGHDHWLRDRHAGCLYVGVRGADSPRARH